jgi:hypothetical protein
MRKYNVRAFDDFVHGTSTVYSTADFNEVLGSADQLSLFAVVDSYSGAAGAPNITVQIQHSGDGRNWVNKNPAAEINGAAIGAGITAVAGGSDGGTNPALGLIRLAISLAAVGMAPPNAHVRIWACGREKEKDKPQVGAAMPMAASAAQGAPPPMGPPGAVEGTANTSGVSGGATGGGCGCGSSAGAGEGCGCGGDRSKACGCKGQANGRTPSPPKPSLRVVQGKGVLEIFGFDSTAAPVSARITVDGAVLLEAGYFRSGGGAQTHVRYGPAFLGAGHDLDLVGSRGIVSGTINGRPIAPVSSGTASIEFADGGPAPEWAPVAGALEQGRALLALALQQVHSPLSGASVGHGAAPAGSPLTPAGIVPLVGCPERFQCFFDWLVCTMNIPPCPFNDQLFCIFFQVIEYGLCGAVLESCLSTIPEIDGAPCDVNLQNCCDGSTCVNGKCCWPHQHACKFSSDCCGGLQCNQGICCQYLPNAQGEAFLPCLTQADCCSPLVCAGAGYCYPPGLPNEPLPIGQCKASGTCSCSNLQPHEVCYADCCQVCFNGQCGCVPGGDPGNNPCNSELDCCSNATCKLDPLSGRYGCVPKQ